MSPKNLSWGSLRILSELLPRDYDLPDRAVTALRPLRLRVGGSTGMSPHAGVAKELVELRNHSRITGEQQDGWSVEPVRRNKIAVMSTEKPTMKIVVIGGTGLIGSKLVNTREQISHDADKRHIASVGSDRSTQMFFFFGRKP